MNTDDYGYFIAIKNGKEVPLSNKSTSYNKQAKSIVEEFEDEENDEGCFRLRLKFGYDGYGYYLGGLKFFN